MPRFKSIILHVGTGKTGSTSIQEFIKKNRPALRRNGIIHPSIWKPESPVRFLSQRMNHPSRKLLGITDANFSEKRHAFLRGFREQLDASKCDHVLLSSEHLAGEPVEGLVELKSILGGIAEKIRIVIYFRRQDQHAVSLYSTAIKSNVKRPMFQAGGMAGHYYDRTCEKWLSVFPDAELVVRIFSKDRLYRGDVVADLLHVAGLPHMPYEAEQTNKSLHMEQANLLKDLYGVMKAPAPVPRDVKQALVRLCERFPPVTKISTSKEDARTYMAHFKESNMRLADIAGSTGPLFNDDFSAYPEIYDYEVRYPFEVFAETIRRLNTMSEGRLTAA